MKRQPQRRREQATHDEPASLPRDRTQRKARWILICLAIVLSVGGITYWKQGGAANLTSAAGVLVLDNRDSDYTAATVSPEGNVYALTSAGTIYGDQIHLIDRAGRLVKSALGLKGSVRAYVQNRWLCTYARTDP